MANVNQQSHVQLAAVGIEGAGPIFIVFSIELDSNLFHAAAGSPTDIRAEFRLDPHVISVSLDSTPCSSPQWGVLQHQTAEQAVNGVAAQSHILHCHLEASPHPTHVTVNGTCIGVYSVFSWWGSPNTSSNGHTVKDYDHMSLLVLWLYTHQFLPVFHAILSPPPPPEAFTCPGIL